MTRVGTPVSCDSRSAWAQHLAICSGLLSTRSCGVCVCVSGHACECVCACVSEREREREREREIYIIEKHDIGEHVFQSDRCRDLHPMLCGITRVTARTPPGIAHTHTYTHRHTPLSLPSRNLSTKKHRQNLNLSEDTHTYTHTSIPATLQFKEAGKTQPKVRHKRSRRLACCWLVAVMRL